MNKQMKQHLEAVVEAIVDQNSAGAKAAFHDYLRLKSQSILMGESVESEEDNDESDKDDEKDEDEKEDKSTDKSKKDEKEDDDKKEDKKDEEDCEM